MTKVSIIGPQRLLPEVMDSVYKSGVIHIESPPDSVKDTPFVGKVTLTAEQRREMAELEGILGIAKKTINIIKPLVET
ncbi:MAG: hypothetical protein HZA12_04545, partial [Nitrospirae bacterium]|nr:hypothetical protein [Nitrospirota bacterium]